MAGKGVIVEYDFAAMDGAGLLYRTTRQYLHDLDGIELDERGEAKYLAGGNYQGALAELFAVVKTKKTSAKAARDLAELFGNALDAEAAKPVTPAFRNFVKALSDRGVRVVIATRAAVEKVALTFAPLLNENVVLYHEESQTYGCVKWDAWRRACVANDLRPYASVAVTGSGADDVVTDLNAATAKKILEILRVA